MKYTTTAGEEILYEASDDVVAFLERVTKAAGDPEVDVAGLTELIYGPDNPLLVPGIFPDRGAVTRAVLQDPAYHVMQDLLFKKELARKGPPAPYGIPVSEAARQLGVHPSAVRQAIRSKNLEATKHEGRYVVDLGSLKSYRSRVGRRGPKGPDLKLRIGNEPGRSFRAKLPGMDVGDAVRGKVREAWVEDFEGRGAVIYGGGGEQTMLVLEPSAEENHVEFGPFFVTGRFVVVTTLTDAAVAAEIWATYRRATQLHLVDTENGAAYWVSANGQRAAMELAREAGGHPTGVVHPGRNASDIILGNEGGASVLDRWREDESPHVITRMPSFGDVLERLVRHKHVQELSVGLGDAEVVELLSDVRRYGDALFFKREAGTMEQGKRAAERFDRAASAVDMHRCLVRTLTEHHPTLERLADNLGDLSKIAREVRLPP